MKLLKPRDDISNDIPDAESNYKAARKNVLIVDDSGFARKILKDMLESEGYNIVGEAGDGLEAIEMAKQIRPDFIFMDVAMPKLDGMGALPRILEVNPNLKVIMSTAMGQKSIIVEAMKIGAIDYVLKPYNKENIIGVLNSHIEAELKNSQVISFEEEKKHHIKERTYEAVIREVKEDVIRKEVSEPAVSEIVPEETVNKESPEAINIEEKQEGDIKGAVLETDAEELSLELLDGGESLESAAEEESLELAAEESPEVSLEEESLDVIAEEETLEIASEEDGLEAVTEEESLSIINEEESLEAIVKEETSDITKEGLVGTVSGQEVPEAITKEEAVGTVSGQEVLEAITKEETAGIVSGQEVPEATTKEGTAGIVSGQEVPEATTKEGTAGIVSGQEVPEAITKEETVGIVSGQEVPEATTKGEMVGTASGQEVPEAVLNGQSAITYDKDRETFNEGGKINFATGIKKTEADIENSLFSYLWINRFDSRHEESFAHRITKEGNYVQNLCGLSNNGNNLSEEENSEQTILFNMVNAYMNLNNRFDNENIIGKYIFRPNEGIRLPTFRVFGSEWYGRDEISLSNILKYSSYNNSQERVYFEKNSLYHMVMNLVQTKADRILGQDRIKI